MNNSRYAGEGKPGRCLRHGVAALIGSMILMVLSGCYWTPGQAQGAISLRITPAENDLAAQELDNSGILLVFVMDESVLRSSPEEAERFFSTVETSSSAEIETLLELDHDEFGSSRFELDYPSTQFQGIFARFEPGGSGARTFSGLTAGAGYLVVVEAHGSTGIEQIGYDVVTVNRGESRQVDVELDNNLGDYHAFLADRYGYSPVDTVGEELSSLVLAVVDLEESLNMVTTSTIGSGVFFYDLINGNLYNEEDNPTFEGINLGFAEVFDTWYDRNDVVALNRDGTPAANNTRDDLSDYESDGFIMIDELDSATTWRLLITMWPSRDETPTSSFPLSAALSEAFTIEPGETLNGVEFPEPHQITIAPVFD